MKLGLLALFVFASFSLNVVAASPCTRVQQETSKQHYDNQGNLRSGSGKFAPKFCPIDNAGTDRHYTCSKPGFRQAAFFYQKNYEKLNKALIANEQIYAARREIFAPVLESYNQGQRRLQSWGQKKLGPAPIVPSKPFAGHALARAAAGGHEITLVDKIRLPPKGAGVMDAYYDTATGMVFGLKYIENVQSKERDLLLLVFKGSDAFTEADDFAQDNKEQFHRGFPPKYLAATLISQQLQLLLIQSKLGCTTTILYTGHSLGGGLALAAAQLAGVRCKSKKDSLVLFNFDTPNTENREMYERQNNSLSIIVDMAIELDLVSAMSLRKKSIMRLLSKNAQLVRFSNLPSSTYDRITSHFLVRFREQFGIMNHGMRPPPAYPSKDSEELLCTWYEPM